MASKGNELMQIGLRLSNCRQNKNMTQEELAARLGITPQAVSKWERGMSLPDISMLADLAGILEVSADWLLGLCEEPEPKMAETNPAGVFAPDFIQKTQSEISKRLRGSLAPIELVFGMGAGARISGGRLLRGTDMRHEETDGGRGHLGAHHPSSGRQPPRIGQEGIHGSFFS